MIKIIYFGAAWCGPCHAYGPQVRNLAPEAEHVDLDDDPDGLARAYGVLSVPTVIVERDGEVVDRFGLLAPAALRQRLGALH